MKLSDFFHHERHHRSESIEYRQFEFIHVFCIRPVILLLGRLAILSVTLFLRVGVHRGGALDAIRGVSTLQRTWLVVITIRIRIPISILRCDIEFLAPVLVRFTIFAVPVSEPIVTRGDATEVNDAFLIREIAVLLNQIRGGLRATGLPIFREVLFQLLSGIFQDLATTTESFCFFFFLTCP